MEYGSRPIHNPKEIYVVGDIHGENCKLEKLLDKILSNFSSQDHLVFCGDYTNHKGPSSPKVLLKIIEIKKIYPEQIFTIFGNHEDMMWKTLNRNFTWIEYTEITPTMN